MIGLKDGAVQLELHSTEWKKIAEMTINILKGILGKVAVEFNILEVHQLLD
jgi:hypothetical protein